MNLSPLYQPATTVYTLRDFEPRIVDRSYLAGLGIRTQPSDETIEALSRGSRLFAHRFGTHTVIPVTRLSHDLIDPSSELEIHNYTGRCPALTFEVSPVQGCLVGCLYCLVTDGVHEQRLVVYDNYPELVSRVLEERRNECHYFYFSPKTEAFQEPTLETGMAHRILQAFIDHFERHPDSQARLFVASKAGARHLEYSHEGVSVLDLFERLRDHMQFNTSVSIMPPEFRSVIEPYAAPIEERLKAVRLCQERGIMANSALVQPIVAPYLTAELMQDFFGQLADAGIVNYKPEFLTACMENLAMLGQLLGHFDKDMERQLYECYISPDNADHRKQRGRTAPSRELCRSYLRRMASVSEPLDLSMSICYWVRSQLGISEDEIPLINRNGFQCLGYQSRLFDGSDRYV